MATRSRSIMHHRRNRRATFARRCSGTPSTARHTRGCCATPSPDALSDIELAAFITACAGSEFELAENIALTAPRRSVGVRSLGRLPLLTFDPKGAPRSASHADLIRIKTARRGAA
jgi:hypothetical protein